MSNMTLTDFLLARIAEDEAVARAASRHPIETRSGDAWTVRRRTDSDEVRHNDGAVIATTVPVGAAAHVARHDPARVLAECEAKRKVVELHDPGVRRPVVDIYDDWCTECHHEEWPCPTLRTLAPPYADHPDFREEWRP